MASEDEAQFFRRLAHRARVGDAERRAHIEGLMGQIRAGHADEGDDPFALSLFECLAVETALLDALVRNTDRMLQVIEEAARGQ
jgi:hypothetical protein